MRPAASKRYVAVIGLEIHARLQTETKIFCGCELDPLAPPNTRVCPVCLGQPGVLPTLNRRAVELALRLALACGCEIAPRSRFARKNYFYPDLPKGYQITQYELPLGRGGALEVEFEDGIRRVPLERMHLEEDAARLVHPPGGELRIDFNRCGAPLVEVVGRPVLHRPREAAELLRSLRRLVRWLEVSDGNMEEGSLRCDANVSIRPTGRTAMGTRVELKNLNSISGVEAALTYEIERQTEILERGGDVPRETRFFDPARGITHRMRGKEEVSDYRYFAEPDLPALVLEPAELERLSRDLPELPLERGDRFMKEWDVPPADASVLCEERELADYFEAMVAEGTSPRLAAQWTVTEVLHERAARGLSMGRFPVAPRRTSALLELLERGEISRTAAKSVFTRMFATDRDPAALVEEMGLRLLTDPQALQSLVEKVLDREPELVERYRGGKHGLLGYFVGKVMQESGGRADPRRVETLLVRRLKTP